LQHTNIVPVYFVGCERGVHFYAMQFVEGQTLAALIQDLRRLEGREGEAPAESRPLGSGSAEPLGKEARQDPRPPEALANWSRADGPRPRKLLAILRRPVPMSHPLP
jgi:hypothetical protein